MQSSSTSVAPPAAGKVIRLTLGNPVRSEIWCHGLHIDGIDLGQLRFVQSQTVAELLGLPDPGLLAESELHARITQLLRHIELVFSPDQLHIDTAGQALLATAFSRFAESLRFQLQLS